MKRLFSILIYLLILHGVFGQSRDVVYNKLIRHELVNGQPSGVSSEVIKKMLCTVNENSITIYNLTESGSNHVFEIVKKEITSGGAEGFTCKIDKSEISLTFSPNDFSLVIFSDAEILILQRGTNEEAENQRTNQKEKKKSP